MTQPEIVPTAAETLRQDPRIAQAKQLIRQAVAEHGEQLQAVRTAEPSLGQRYAELLEQASAARGAALLWPYLASGLGQGPFVELADGSVKLDFIGGIGVYGCGHSHPAMVDAAIDAAIEDVVMQGNLQQHPPSIRMCQRLLELAATPQAPLTHCMLSTSGAMANENALKLAFHSAAPADRVIAFDHAFAGRSIALAAITDRPAYRQGVPLALAVDYLPNFDPDDAAGSTARAREALTRLLQRHPGRYAAFWAELIAGEGGYYPGSRAFFTALLAPIRQAGIPIIFDEVQTFARTSRPLAFQHYGLDEYADIVTIGKITQVCATLYRESYKPSAPILSQTFTGASSSIAAGLATLEALRCSGCFGDDGWNVRRHRHFAARLAALADKHPGKLGGPFGEGMMIALTPGGGSPAEANKLMRLMFDEGLLGFICGGGPTRLRFLPPPAVTTEAHIDLAIELLDRALAKFTPAG